MNDPLLTDRAPGILGRAILRLPIQMGRAVFAILMFIPMTLLVSEGDFGQCFKDAVAFVVWGDSEPPAP